MTALVLRAGVVDAIVALLAKTAVRLYTSEPGDPRKLCTATGCTAGVIGC